MGNVIAFLSVGLFIAFIVGLVRPSLVRMPNRKRSSVIYLGGSLVLSIIGSIVDPSVKTQNIEQSVTKAEVAKPVQKSFEYGDKTLEEYRREPTVKRHDIVNSYVDFKSLPASVTDGFYGCMSEYSFTKSDALKLSDVLGWCFSSYEREPGSLSNKINLDAFQNNFSVWDGSYRPLEKLIKSNMNDDSSYKHVSTTYSLVLNKDPHAIVKTTFRGTNTYGGVVKQTVGARVDVRTGEVVSILDN